jgi:2,3-bisphosphoglycerate-independent phosphoglycerate mutase
VNFLSFAEKLKHPASSLHNSMTAVVSVELKLRLRSGDIVIVCDHSEKCAIGFHSNDPSPISGLLFTK